MKRSLLISFFYWKNLYWFHFFIDTIFIDFIFSDSILIDFLLFQFFIHSIIIESIRLIQLVLIRLLLILHPFNFWALPKEYIKKSRQDWPFKRYRPELQAKILSSVIRIIIKIITATSDTPQFIHSHCAVHLL